MATPKRPTGFSPEAIFDQWLYDQVQALRVNDSADVRVTRGRFGITLGVKASSGGASTPVTAKEFHFQQSLGDYFLTTEGTAVAKLPEIRCSIAASSVYQVGIGYTYPHNPAGGGPSSDPLAYLYRVANYAGSTENQGIIPSFFPGNIIMAMPAVTSVMSDPKDHVTSGSIGTPVPITWVQISSAMWTRFSDQSFGT